MKKYKSLITLVLILFLQLSVSAQMIFEEGDWASVKAKAKQENKIIFIDLYTTWCGPCKVMAKNIFPLPEVGDFYNANFINYKIDAEKGEGIDLKTKYGVSAFPTYVFTDADGNFLHQSVGAFPADEFIKEGRVALDPSKQLKNLIADGKQLSKEEVPAYLRDLRSKNLPYNDKFEVYLKNLSKKELLSNETFEIIKEFGGRQPQGYPYEILFKNREEMATVVGEQVLNNHFFRLFLEDAYMYRGRKEPYQPVLDKVNELGFDFANKIYDTIELGALIYTDKDYAAFVQQAPTFIEKYVATDMELKHYPVYAIGSLFFLRDPELEKFIIALAEEMVEEDDPNSYRLYPTLANGYFKANQLDKAIAYYKKAIKYALSDEEANQYHQLVDIVKERKAIIAKAKYTFNGEGYDDFNGYTISLQYPI